MANAYVVDDESLRGAHVEDGVDAKQGLLECGLKVDAELSFEERPSHRIRIPSRRVQFDIIKILPRISVQRISMSSGGGVVGGVQWQIAR
jgi:hypothetical protein